MKKPFKIFLSIVCLVFSSFFAYAQTQTQTCTSTHMVTAAEYCDFLNQAAASDPNHLYDEHMATDPGVAFIVRVGAPGSWHYEVIAGREDFLVCYVSSCNESSYSDWLQERLQATGCRLQEGWITGGTLLKSNLSSFQIDEAGVTGLILAVAAPTSTSNFNAYIKDISGVVGLIGLVAFGHELMLKDDRVSEPAPDQSLTLNDVRAAVIAYPTASRFVIIKNEGRFLIQPKEELSGNVGKNISENIATNQTLRSLLLHEGSPEAAKLLLENSYLNASHSTLPPLSSIILKDILKQLPTPRFSASAGTTAIKEVTAAIEAWNKAHEICIATESSWAERANEIEAAYREVAHLSLVAEAASPQAEKSAWAIQAAQAWRNAQVVKNPAVIDAKAACLRAKNVWSDFSKALQSFISTPSPKTLCDVSKQYHRAQFSLLRAVAEIAMARDVLVGTIHYDDTDAVALAFFKLYESLLSVRVDNTPFAVARAAYASDDSSAGMASAGGAFIGSFIGHAVFAPLLAVVERVSRLAVETSLAFDDMAAIRAADAASDNIPVNMRPTSLTANAADVHAAAGFANESRQAARQAVNTIWEADVEMAANAADETAIFTSVLVNWLRRTEGAASATEKAAKFVSNWFAEKRK